MIRKTVLFGGTGMFGKAYREAVPDVLSPPSTLVDVTDQSKVFEYLSEQKPSCVIHAAAVVGRKKAEQDRQKTYSVNVEGTLNVALACVSLSIRMIYLSSVAIFDGTRGNYKEDDLPNPAYYYGWTKLMGEVAVRMHNNHVIVRTDFFDPASFKYPKAFSDHVSSAIHVREAVRAVDEIAKSNYVGVINVGQKGDFHLNILKRYLPKIEGIRISESTMPDFPRNLSLDISLYEELFLRVV